MAKMKKIALRCRISRGGFSGERLIEVESANGEVHRGLAPRQYCWKNDESILGLEEPSTGMIDGLVAALQVQAASGEGKVVVSIPDGDVFIVSSETIAPRPSPESELASNVSFGS